VELTEYLLGNNPMRYIAQFIGTKTKLNKINCLAFPTELLHNVIHKSCAKLFQGIVLMIINGEISSNSFP
jgi:hypothetical protein